MRKSSFLIELKDARSGASKAALSNFERETGVTIPPDYREFLLCQNGGSPLKRNFTFGSKAYQDSVLRYFFGIECPLDFNLRLILQDYAGRIPTYSFPIANDEFDNLILLSRKRGVTDRIFFWDHEAEPRGGALIEIAPNLRHFLRMLEEDKVIEYNMATIAFVDGEKFRRILPAKLFSIDRNAAVDVREARVGERINDFGVTRTISAIEFSREKGTA